MTRTAIVVPVKEPAQAKSRLRPVLDERQRRGLVAAMLGDVLRAVPADPDRCRVFVVATAQVEVPRGVTRITEPASRGYNAAIDMALADPAVRRARSMLVLPADLPLVTSEDIDLLIAAAPVPGMRIAPDRDGDGTNALLLSPPGLVATGFGPESSARHRASGEAAGVSVETVIRPGLAFDIDTPQDLADFCACAGRTGTHRYLRQTGVAARLAGRSGLRERG